MACDAQAESGFIRTRARSWWGWVRFCVLVFALQSAEAQVVDWVQTYPLGSVSWVNGAVPMLDGGYVLVGQAIFPPDNYNSQVVLIRTNAEGDTLWWRAYGSPKDEYLHCAAIVNGEIWAGGTFDSTDAGWFVSEIWRFSLNGDSLGVRSYLALYTSIERMRVTPDGNVLVTMSGDGLMLAKLDTQGNIIWTVDGPPDHQWWIRAIDVLANGTAVVACYSGIQTMWAYWIDPNGEVEDSVQNVITNLAGAESIVALSDTDAVIAGWIQTGPNFFDQSPFIFRVGRSGAMAWEVTQTNEWAYNAAGVYLIHDTLAVVTWKAFTEASLGNPIVDSYTLSGGHPDSMMMNVTPGQGAYVAVTGTEQVLGSRVLVVGAYDLLENPTGWQSFCAQVSFGPTAVEPRGGPQLADSWAMQLYPNPFNSQATLTLYLPRPERVEVVMYDVLGRAVRKIADKVLPPGEQRMLVNGEGLSSGVYLVRVSAGEERRMQKMVLLK